MQGSIWDLAKFGFCWQFITLAGFHCDAMGISLFAWAYTVSGALAYVSLIQRTEGVFCVETLTHLQSRGSELVDEAGTLVSGGTSSSTSIMSAGVTMATARCATKLGRRCFLYSMVPHGAPRGLGSRVPVVQLAAPPVRRRVRFGWRVPPPALAAPAAWVGWGYSPCRRAAPPCPRCYRGFGGLGVLVWLGLGSSLYLFSVFG